MSSPGIKNIPLFKIPKSVAYADPFRFVKRGRIARSSRTSGRNAMDAVMRRVSYARRPAKLRTAKSCGPGAATVASIHAGPCWRGNGDNQRRSPGRARISRQTIARGKPGCLGCTCQIRVRFLLPIAHGARRSRRPAFPAPLCPGNLSECANGRLRTNRPLLELSPLRPKATEPVVERGTAPVSSSTRTVARASSPDRARKGVDDGTK